MGRYQLLEVTAETVIDLANQVRDSLLKSRPADAADYASALKDAAIAYDVLDPQDDDA